PDVSDHHQVKPQPVRPIDDLDRLRALIRWRNQQAQAAEDAANEEAKDDDNDGDGDGYGK
ncbi:MAG: hypothetical protein WAS51_02615, partial [Ilumatobacteraceae bacterium]